MPEATQPAPSALHGNARRQTSGADLMLLLTAVIWGSSYGVTKQALVWYPVLGFLVLRFGLTSLLLLPALRRCTGAALRAGLPLGLILLAIFVCETYGVLLTQASNAAFLISLNVVMTPFAEWWMFGARPRRAAFVLALVSLAGTALLSAGGPLSLNTGDGLILLAALLRAAMMCWTKRLTMPKPGRPPVPALTLTAVQSAVVFAGMLLAACCVPGSLPPLPHVASFWGACIYLVLLCTIFAFFAQNYGVRRSGPTRAALLMGSEPLFGALFAACWLGEKLTPLSWLGALLLCGAVLASLLPGRAPPLPVGLAGPQ